MLYCPNCNRDYKVGAQRFCDNDGRRLLPALNSVRSVEARHTGVFARFINNFDAFRNDGDESRVASSLSGLEVESGRIESAAGSRMLRESIPDGEPSEPDQQRNDGGNEPPHGKNYSDSIKKEKQSGLRIEFPGSEGELDKRGFAATGRSAEGPAPDDFIETDGSAKPLGRLIDPKKVHSGTAPVGDRTKGPAGQLAVTLENPEVLLGQRVKGRYRVTEVFDKDQSSVAFLAEDQILKGQNVVVRVVVKSPAKNGFEEKILLEERISFSHVDHPNVAKVIDSGELPEGKPFIVTAELRENSVADLIENDLEVDLMRVARIIRQVSYGLSEVHQNGVLHRNLKPAHILLTESDSGVEHVKVTDFCVSDGSMDRSNYQYRAPEQIAGQLSSFATDGYALAVIAYRLLTNKFPFEGNSGREVLGIQKAGLIVNPSVLNKSIGSEVDSVFIRALSFEQSNRYPRTRDFGEALFNALAGGDPVGSAGAEMIDKSKVSIQAFNEAGVSSVVTKELPNESGPNPMRDIRIPANVESFIEADPPEGQREEFSFEKSGSPEPVAEKSTVELTTERGHLWVVLPIAGLLVVVLIAFWIWSYYL